MYLAREPAITNSNRVFLLRGTFRSSHGNKKPAIPQNSHWTESNRKELNTPFPAPLSGQHRAHTQKTRTNVDHRQLFRPCNLFATEKFCKLLHAAGPHNKCGSC